MIMYRLFTISLVSMYILCVCATNPDYKQAKSCYVSVGYNIDYQGDVGYTETGKVCQNWKSTTWARSDFDGTMSNNFCRNPDKSPTGPWCVVRGGKRENCNLARCASSAMFNGRGNIEHISYPNSTTSDRISFTFYTDTTQQDGATLIAVKSWSAGLLEVKLTSTARIQDTLQLKWSLALNKPPVTLHSRPRLANGELVRVEIIRDYRQLIMKVNDEEHSTTITEMSSKDAIFEYPGNIFIGKSPYGKAGFAGCISDVEINAMRPLDVAMGSRVKSDSERITISTGVWEGCLLIPPSDLVQKVVVPLNGTEDDGINMTDQDKYELYSNNTTGELAQVNSALHRTPLSLIMMLLFSYLVCSG